MANMDFMDSVLRGLAPEHTPSAQPPPQNPPLANLPTVGHFQLDDEQALGLVNDLAMDLHKPAVVAERYGLSLAQLHQWLSQPEILRRVHTRKAHWLSGANIVERARALYGLVMIDAVGRLDKMIHDPASPPAVVMDALKAGGKFATLDAPPARPDPNANANQPGNAPFAINIVFSGGTERVAVLTDSPRVIDAEQD